MASTADRGRGGIQSLHRAFDILELVADSEVLGATRIAENLELSVSTVNNLCRTMVDRGYLIGRRGQYRLGPALGISARRWNPMAALPDIVAPTLEAITESTGQASVATVLSGRAARVVAFEQGRGPVGTPPPRGDRRALDLPTGTVLVALTRPNEWAAFIGDSVEPGVENSQQFTRELEQELEHVHADNICGRRSADRHGQTALAVPVWSAGTAVACAIGVSAPTYLADDALIDRMLDALRRESPALSRSLGAQTIPTIAHEIRWCASR